MIPLNMAFDEAFGDDWDWVLAVIDLIFFTDVIVIFNTAFEDEDYRIIDDRKTIAISYLKNWFFIDIIAIIPFDLIII